MLPTELIFYDLKVAALVAVFYLFYMLLLARETTHTLNRIVLLSAIVLSAVLPLCVITLHRTVVVESRAYPIMEPAAVDDATFLSITEALDQSFDWTIPVAIVMLAGTILRLLYLSQSYRKLRRLIRSGEKHILPSGTTVSVVDAPLVPFSWMQTMVLPRADWCAKAVGHSEVLPAILAHEEAHVRHRHSYDVVVVEVLTALQWFNPVVWFLRQELRVVHEYEADASVLSCGFDESQYIHLLMQKATGIQACALANGIHTTKTKKRILMMLKTKSNRIAWLKALYIVPIVMASLAMTARTVVDYKTATTEDSAAVRLFHENTNGRGDSYLIRHMPDVKFYNNGKEETVPGDRSIALEVSKTELRINGQEVDKRSLPNIPASAVSEIHLDETSSDHYVVNLTTAEPLKYSARMGSAEYVAYVQQKKAAGMDSNELTRTMLNEDGAISRAHILHKEAVYGSKKPYLFIVDGQEVTGEDFARIEPESIESVTVMDVGPAKKTFGEKGRRGATVVQTKQQGDDKIYDVVEQMPQFPGGDTGLMQFIARNIKYPEAATKHGVQGRVIVQFIVEKDGSLSNAKVLENPKGSGASPVVVTAMMPEKERQDAESHNAGVQAMRDEAIRVVNAMPRWSPGKQKGKPVRCKYVIPVTYRLN